LEFNAIKDMVMSEIRMSRTPLSIRGVDAKPMRVKSGDIPNVENMLASNMESNMDTLVSATPDQMKQNNINRSVGELLFFASGFALGSGKNEIDSSSMEEALGIFKIKGWTFPFFWCGTGR
jgi:hypothetical protein